MDRMGADFFRGVKMIRERLGAHPVPIQIPIGSEENFNGIIDLVTMDATLYDGDKQLEHQPIPEDMVDKANEYRDVMLEALADFDDELMEMVLEGEEISQQKIMDVIRTATIGVKMTPVLCGSSFKNKGVRLLLNAIVNYLPSPIDVPPIGGYDPDNEEECVREADDNGPSALWHLKLSATLCGETYILPRLFR